jgi:hypothetical protein
MEDIQNVEKLCNLQSDRNECDEYVGVTAEAV